MKKSNLIYSLIYTILAGISLYVAIAFDNKMSGIFYGMTAGNAVQTAGGRPFGNGEVCVNLL